MARLRHLRSLRVALLSALVVLVLSVSSSFAADVTTPFTGKAVNGGTVTHEMQGGKHILTVSSDFVVPVRYACGGWRFTMKRGCSRAIRVAAIIGRDAHRCSSELFRASRRTDGEEERAALGALGARGFQPPAEKRTRPFGQVRRQFGACVVPRYVGDEPSASVVRPQISDARPAALEVMFERDTRVRIECPSR